MNQIADAQKQGWKVWKTIKLGTGLRAATDFLVALKQAGNVVGQEADYILTHPTFTVSEVETEVGLVVISVKDLGFERAGYKEIYNQIDKLGLGCCPAEVGPQLRLQYPGQPAGEDLLIAMSPVPLENEGMPIVFYLYTTSDIVTPKRGIAGANSYPVPFWDSNTHFVFMCRR